MKPTFIARGTLRAAGKESSELLYQGPCKHEARHEALAAVRGGRYTKVTIGHGDAPGWGIRDEPDQQPTPMPVVDAALLTAALAGAEKELANVDAAIQAGPNLSSRLGELENELATLAKAATDAAGSGADDFEATIARAGRIAAVKTMLPLVAEKCRRDDDAAARRKRDAEHDMLLTWAKVARLAAVPIIAADEVEHEKKAAKILASVDTTPTRWELRTLTGRGSAASLPARHRDSSDCPPVYVPGNFQRWHIERTRAMAAEALALLEQAQPAPETRPPAPLRTKAAA